MLSAKQALHLRVQARMNVCVCVCMSVCGVPENKIAVRRKQLCITTYYYVQYVYVQRFRKNIKKIKCIYTYIHIHHVQCIYIRKYHKYQNQANNQPHWLLALPLYLYALTHICLQFMLYFCCLKLLGAALFIFPIFSLLL